MPPFREESIRSRLCSYGAGGQPWRILILHLPPPANDMSHGKEGCKDASVGSRSLPVPVRMLNCSLAGKDHLTQTVITNTT